MAEFVKPSGSVGTWSSEQGTLTISLGETAQLLLIGGGPPGQEKLSIAFDGVIDAKAVQEFPWEVKDQRLFCISPAQAGSGRIVARLPNGGPPYTRTIQIIVLPRKPSSLGTESVIIWGKAQKDEWIQGAQHKAEQMSPPAVVMGIPSFAEFQKFLTNFRDT